MPISLVLCPNFRIIALLYEKPIKTKQVCSYTECDLREQLASEHLRTSFKRGEIVKGGFFCENDCIILLRMINWRP